MPLPLCVLTGESQIVSEASDGLQAVRKAEELQPDLILLDIGLPKLNGIEAARQEPDLPGGSSRTALQSGRVAPS